MMEQVTGEEGTGSYGAMETLFDWDGDLEEIERDKWRVGKMKISRPRRG